MAKVKLTNTSTATVYVESTLDNFKLILPPSRIVEITEKQYDGVSYDQGFQSLVGSGFIKVENPNEVENFNIPVTEETKITKEEVKKIYSDKNYSKFTTLIQKASPAAKDVFTEVAVEMKVTDNAFVALIKKYCNNFDVIKAISFKHEAEE